jgi:hypothetical protein
MRRSYFFEFTRKRGTSERKSTNPIFLKSNIAPNVGERVLAPNIMSKLKCEYSRPPSLGTTYHKYSKSPKKIPILIVQKVI